MIKNFRQFLLEEESLDSNKPESEETQESEPKTKDVKIGETSSGEKVEAQIKVGHAIELTPEDFTRIQNMRVTQYERDMFPFSIGTKDYKVSKDKDGKCTIFHNHQTLHKLVPVGVFMCPKTSEA